MNHKKIIIQSLVRLGAFMAQFTGSAPIKSEKVPHNDVFFDGFKPVSYTHLRAHET